MFGNVLIGGLSMGLMLYALSWNPRVKQITVYEDNKDILSVILPHILAPVKMAKKLKVVEKSFWEYEGDYDCVFFDELRGKISYSQKLALYIHLRSRFKIVRMACASPTELQTMNDAYYEVKRAMKQHLEQPVKQDKTMIPTEKSSIGVQPEPVSEETSKSQQIANELRRRKVIRMLMEKKKQREIEVSEETGERMTNVQTFE